MKAYPKYKDSGIEWLGEIPDGWKVKRLKCLSDTRVSNVDKKSEEDEVSVMLCNYTDVYNNEFIDEKIKFMSATATEGQIIKLKLKEGDVIITKDSETPDDIGVPSYVALKETNNIVCGYHLAIITPNNCTLSGKYLFRLFQSNKFRAYFEISSDGVTRFGLDKYSILNVEIRVPPLNEQKNIADFLDLKTTQIDALIEKKRKKIELLKEQRAVIINHAVTKGLDPNAPMKDSGIEWLGKIPEHWVMVRIGNIFKLTSGKTRPKILKTCINGEYKFPVYGGNGIMGFSRDFLIESNTVVLGRVGEYCGSVHVTKSKSWISDNALFINKMLMSDFSISFLALALRSVDLNKFKNETGQPLITHEIVYNQKIPLFPLTEQKEIAEYLEGKTQQIDTLIEKEEKFIKLLQEYRTALISEVVTGKIDVRNEVQL
ncbi:MAG: restriction endonuclease subunit S [Candidatus Brocadiales bacterium]